jgi:hypothetical protein
VNPLRSVGARLSLALLLLVAGALGFVYLIVAPSLEDRLINAKLSQLGRAAPSIAAHLPEDQTRWTDFLENAAASANARIVLYDQLGPPIALQVVGDSRQSRSSTDVQNDPTALRVALTLRRSHGTVRRGGERYAEVAVPSTSGPIVLLSASLHDSLGNVQLVRRRLLAGGCSPVARSRCSWRS